MPKSYATIVEIPSESILSMDELLEATERPSDNAEFSKGPRSPYDPLFYGLLNLADVDKGTFDDFMHEHSKGARIGVNAISLSRPLLGEVLLRVYDKALEEKNTKKALLAAAGVGVILASDGLDGFLARSAGIEGDNSGVLSDVAGDVSLRLLIAKHVLAKNPNEKVDGLRLKAEGLIFVNSATDILFNRYSSTKAGKIKVNADAAFVMSTMLAKALETSDETVHQQRAKSLFKVAEYGRKAAAGLAVWDAASRTYKHIKPYYDPLEKIKERYHLPTNGRVDAARIAADMVSLIRIPQAEKIRNQLDGDKHFLEDRDWAFAAMVAGVLIGDKVDGILGAMSQRARGAEGKDWAGGWIDQLSDKMVSNMIIQQLIDNGEIPPEILEITSRRDKIVNTGRVAMDVMGIPSNADPLAQAKTALNFLGIVIACSPLNKQNPGLVEDIFKAATTLSVITGSDYMEKIPKIAVNLITKIHKESIDDLVPMLNALTGNITLAA